MENKTVKPKAGLEARRRALAYARSCRTPESFRTPARGAASRDNGKSGGGYEGRPYKLSEAGLAKIQAGQATRRSQEKQTTGAAA